MATLWGMGTEPHIMTDGEGTIGQHRGFDEGQCAYLGGWGYA